MTQRIAGAMALIAFALCLVSGLTVGNPMGTIILRALLAMVITLFIGLVVGAMAQKMLDENLKINEEKLKNRSVPSTEDGR